MPDCPGCLERFKDNFDFRIWMPKSGGRKLNEEMKLPLLRSGQGSSYPLKEVIRSSERQIAVSIQSVHCEFWNISRAPLRQPTSYHVVHRVGKFSSDIFVAITQGRRRVISFRRMWETRLWAPY